MDERDQINLIQEDIPDVEVDEGNMSVSDEDNTNMSVAEQVEIDYKEDPNMYRPLWNWEKITDWKKRIAKYDESQQRFYTNMVPKIQEMKGIFESDQGWTLLVHNQEQDIKIETKKSVRGLTLMRSVGHIDYPVVDIVRTYFYGPLRKNWDTNIDMVENKKKIGVNAFVSYARTIKYYMVKAREFITNGLVNEEADGSVVFVSSSDNCEYVDKFPPVSGVIRAYTAVTGAHFIPVETNRTMVKICVEIDLKGGIPDFAMRQVLKDQGYQIEKLRKTVPMMKAKFPGDTLPEGE